MSSSDLTKIKIVETSDPARTLINAATYNHVARALRNMSIQGGEIGLNATGGIHIQVMPAVLGSGGGGTYDGPFAVAVSGNTATVSAGVVYAGTTPIQYNGGTCPVADGNNVVINIQYANGSYTVTAAPGAYGTTNNYPCYLGIYQGGEWHQWWQAGHIQVCGRIV